jgi:aminoglycoside phosphotransferase (APT) family kinase protein
MTNKETDYLDRLVDEPRLAEFLASSFGQADAYSVTRHSEGHSNETLFVEWGDQELVIRRPPPGETATTAHDILREYRVVEALQSTDVPVPPTLTACTDHDVMGSDFYVMERMDGVIPRDSEPPMVDSADSRWELGIEFVDTLARIHTVDYEAVGLEELGAPDGFTQRQVNRWGEQLDWAFERTESEREVPELHFVGEWLQSNCPTSYPQTLVHGDYKLDNVMYREMLPVELIAVFDWEMATLGDPRVDLGWMLSYWRNPEDPAPIMEKYISRFMEKPEYPSRRDLVDGWEEQTGLDYDHERFYRVLAVYKIAAIDEMFYRRYLEGNSDDELYAMMEERVPVLADRAVRIIEGEEPL